jgi:FtsP/CotA-like multicopper oxidase with cupredoxin domain
MFVEETNEQVNRIIRQIGSDGGLLRTPVSVPAAGLLLAPAERADLIVDFRAYAGKRLVWRNDAPAPFPG